MNEVVIYGLKDPRTGAIFYVGKTICIEQRLSWHLTTKRGGRARYRWICDLKREGLRPELVVLEQCREDNWRERERDWEVKLRKRGEPLTNLAECGYGPILSQVKTWAGFIDPQGQPIEPIRNLAAFCRVQGLCPQSMALVYRGVMNSHRGWSCTYNGIRENRKVRRWVGFVNPEGNEVAPFQNLKAFCRKRGLNDGHMVQVYRGTIRQHRGWTCVNPETLRALASLPEDPRIKTWSGFVDPAGNSIPTFRNLFAFCREHGLANSSMQVVALGKLKEHRGWTNPAAWARTHPDDAP